MLYILKHIDIYINKCCKLNQCQNDDSKSMYGEKKSPVFASDEMVQSNQDCVYF